MLGAYRDTLNIIMVRGHKNVFDCERIFNELKGYLKLGGGDFLRGRFVPASTFADRRQDIPRTAAAVSVYS